MSEQVWEVWGKLLDGKPVECAFSMRAGIDKLREQGLVDPQLVLLKTIVAETYEEAMTKYHEFMGWPAYVPTLRDEGTELSD